MNSRLNSWLRLYAISEILCSGKSEFLLNGLSSDIILFFNIAITQFLRALVLFDARACSFMPTSDIYARGVDEKT